MTFMKKLALFAFVAMLPSLAVGAGKTLVNVDKTGLALKGYDPVAYFTENRPVEGNPQFVSTYNGARYQFASAANKNTFDADPAKYEPQFGGFCAYGVSKGYTVPIKVEAFGILNGRLLLQYDLGAREEFNRDPQGNLQKADGNWPKLVEKQGR